MSLSGNLGFVPIDEVLRLLTRSHQKGSIEVTGSGVKGRVFVGEGGIDLATTYDDTDLSRHLLNSGYADQKALARIAAGETTLAAITDDNPAIVELLREMSVEGLYHMGTLGDEFEVRERATTPFASPETFDLESLLEDVDQRTKDWSEVAAVIPDLSRPVTFRRDLGEREEVTVKGDDWRFLSEIGDGSAVEEIAERLGTTEFWTARVATQLLAKDLIVMAGSEASALAPEEMIDDPSEGEVHEDMDPDESWWEEPRDEDPLDVAAGRKTPEVVSEGLSEMPSVEAAAPAEERDVEEDTEAFLEKVFSELGSSEPNSDEGHGLLRRRRMGTLRDFSSDS